MPISGSDIPTLYTTFIFHATKSLGCYENYVFVQNQLYFHFNDTKFHLGKACILILGVLKAPHTVEKLLSGSTSGLAAKCP